MERTFDRVVKFDQRSRAFRAVEGIEEKNFRNYTWPLDVWLNQGTQGACVAFGICHELAAIPVEVSVTDDFAFKLYDEAKKIDEWEGENYEGTSVLAGFKAAQKRLTAKGKPLIAEYRWVFGIEDLIRVLGRKGPVVIGVNWYSGMDNVDANGFIHKSGFIRGGHCVVLPGQSIKFLDKKGPKNKMENVDMDSGYAIIQNSWGKENWGTDGRAKISLRDLSALLQENGECAVPVIRNK